MSKQCQMCGITTMFYVWTSSRNFFDSISETNLETAKKLHSGDGNPICFHCYNKLKEDA